MSYLDIIDNPKIGQIQPCRYCGVVPEIVEGQLEQGSRTVKTFEIKCRNKYCASNVTWATSREEIIAIWNRGRDLRSLSGLRQLTREASATTAVQE